MNVVKTASGKHTIFHVSDPLLGKISDAFGVETAKGGDWFFQPSHWCPNGEFYGSIGIAYDARTKTLMLYSPGYESATEALKAAEQWEIDAENLAKHHQEYNKIEWATIKLS